MNNIQKSFKTKSKLRGMADGGVVQRVRDFFNPPDDRSDTDRAAGVPKPGSTEENKELARRVTKQPGFFPTYSRSQLRQDMVGEYQKQGDRVFASGMADGGQVDSRVLGSGMAQRAGSALQGRRAQLDAAIDAASGAPPRPAPTPAAAAPAKKPEEKSALRSFFGLADGGSPADVDRIMNSRDMSIFSPQEMKTFNGMGQAAMADAAQMQDVGVQAGQAALAAARPAELPAVGTDDMAPPEIELADGGKVRGKGGPTDDKVGPVALSDGEYVLPADTVDIVGRDKLDALRLATHDFVDEDNKPKVSRLRKMANGGPYEPPVTKPPTTETPRPQAGATSKLGNAVRAGGALLATGLEAKNVYDAYQSGGVDAAVPEAAMGATRLASAKLGASAGAALPLPGWGKPVAAAVGGVAGYMAPDAVANSEYMQEKGRESALRGAFSSRLDKDFAPTFDPRANTITTSDGRVFGSGRLESNPHLQYQGYLDAKAGQAVDSKAPLVNPTVAELDAIGALRPRNSPPAVNVKVDPTMADLERDGVLRPAVSMDSAMGALRSGNEPGGGFTQTNVPGIFGRKSSDPKHDLGEYIGVGKPDPQEDPIMGEIRSALRGLTDGAGNRGGGGGASIGSGNASEINARYDKLASQLSGMYGPKGQGNLARRLLELEQSRSGALDADARNQSSLRGQDMSASTAANSANMQARMQALQTLGTMANQRSTQSAQEQAAQLKALQDAQTQSEERMGDNAKVFESIADTFAAGDKDKQSQYRELLSTLPPELHAAAQGLAPEDKRAFYTNIVRQQLGRNEGLVLGRDAGATVQNAVIGGLVGRMTRFGGGAGGKAVDSMLGKIPRIGPVLSALRPAENLARFGTLIGAAGGAYATPAVENLTRWDPLARDPETGAALPARKDIREAATYGAVDTYLNPFDDSVQTVSGRRTNKPTPDEEEAARRFRSALRN